MLKKIDARLKRYSKTIKELEVGSYWYRRLVHVAPFSMVLALFLLANESWATIVKTIGAPVLMATIVGMDVLRVKGVLPQEMFYGIRGYEQDRLMAHSYYIIATGILFILAQLELIPQSILVVCFACCCFVDPVIGEVRQAKGRKWAMPVGFLVGLILFISLGFGWYMSLLGAFLALTGESVKSWLIDDNFLIQMLPAAGLIIAWKAGLQMPPDPVVPIAFAEWAYIDMGEFPLFGWVLAMAIIIAVSGCSAYYGLRHRDKKISATKSMLPFSLFLMIAPYVFATLFLLNWSNSPHPYTHTLIGVVAIVSIVIVDIATIRDMMRNRKIRNASG
ncbi:MAG TPA: hypothetical protein HA346_03485 [Thermoplasmata archaeon]|nr:hypothetical protein [Thermoplasmata archaeon]